MKRERAVTGADDLMSPPAWGRGLKPTIYNVGIGVIESPPAWGRGLKLIGGKHLIKISGRPPRGGVD